MGDAAGDLAAWGGGIPIATSQDFESVPWTAAEIDELALIFDSAQASSANTSPSLVAFATPPEDTLALQASTSHTGSNASTPSSSATPPQTGDKRKRDRERNTEAARRYRKRRVDETEDLRASLAAMTKERDSLRLQLVKAETEAELLRNLGLLDQCTKERDQLKATVASLQLEVYDNNTALRKLEDIHAETLFEVSKHARVCKSYRDQIWELKQDLENLSDAFDKDRHVIAGTEVLANCVWRRERALAHHSHLVLKAEYNAAFLQAELETTQLENDSLQQENAELRQSTVPRSTSSVSKKKNNWRVSGKAWR